MSNLVVFIIMVIPLYIIGWELSTILLEQYKRRLKIARVELA